MSGHPAVATIHSPRPSLGQLGTPGSSSWAPEGSGSPGQGWRQSQVSSFFGVPRAHQEWPLCGLCLSWVDDWAPQVGCVGPALLSCPSAPGPAETPVSKTRVAPEVLHPLSEAQPVIRPEPNPALLPPRDLGQPGFSWEECVTPSWDVLRRLHVRGLTREPPTE